MDNPESFMAGLKARQADIDYGDLFKGDAGSKAEAAAKIITECIPCFDRIFDGAQLLPDGDLLEIHLLNIMLRTDLLDKLRELFRDPGFNLDICELLRMLSHLCPQDLLAILALLSQYLAKLNLDFKFNLDLIIELLGPILSPFLDALAEWLDKWVQMILAPIICVIDHINMTIYIAQQFKLPLSEAQVNLDYHAGVAGPAVLEKFGTYANAQQNAGFHTGLGQGRYDPMLGDFQPEQQGYDPFVWGYTDTEAFNTPDSEKYNPEVPVPPEEEIQLALAQMRDDLGIEKSEDVEPGSIQDLTVEERQKMWDQIKYDYWQKENVNIPPPLRKPDPRDGTRWSPDNIPQSQKSGLNLDFGKDPLGGEGFDMGAHPPEDQTKPGEADDYYIDGGRLISPIIQMRNIIMAGIRWVQDWFEWATQQIYDLLGTDFGWMKKKMGNTMLKSRIIQLIYMIKAIIEAIAKNGLKCGINTNFSNDQLRFILVEVMSKITPYQYKPRLDGTFELVLPKSAYTPPVTADQASEAAKAVAAEEVPKPTPEQKAVKSGIIIKDCLKQVKADDVERVRKWIADFERRTNG
jgi:hypothetical protein